MDALLHALVHQNDVAIASHLRRGIEVAAVFQFQIPEMQGVVDEILELDNEKLRSAPRIADVWCKDRVDWRALYTSSETGLKMSNTTPSILSYLKPFGKAVSGIEDIYDVCSSYIHPSNRVMRRYRDPTKALSIYGLMAPAINIYSDTKIARQLFALSLVLGKSGNGGLANRLNPVLPAVIDQLDLGLQQLALMRKNLWKLHGPIVRSLFRQQRFTDDPDLAKLPCPCGSGRDFCKCCG